MNARWTTRPEGSNWGDGRSIESGPPGQIFDDPQTQRARDFVAKIIRH